MADGHVIARIGDRHFESLTIDPSRITQAPILAIEKVEVAPEIDRAQRAVAALIRRQVRRLRRESHLRIAPGWIDEDPPHFAFLGFAPRARPFDWRFDEADVPVEPRPPTPYPEKARLRLFLRPPAPAVRR